MNFRRTLINASCLLILGFCFYRNVRESFAYDSYDFSQFWVAGQAIKQLPIENLYSREDRQLIREKMNTVFLKRENRLPELTGTPFLYAIFSLAATGDYMFDQHSFRIFSAVSLLLAAVDWELYLDTLFGLLP